MTATKVRIILTLISILLLTLIPQCSSQDSQPTIVEIEGEVVGCFTYQEANKNYIRTRIAVRNDEGQVGQYILYGAVTLDIGGTYNLTLKYGGVSKWSLIALDKEEEPCTGSNNVTPHP